MSTNGVNGPFNGDFKVRLQDRGPKSSGITWELKNIFEELRKNGQLKDTDGKGLTKQDALNMYEALNKIHEERNLATNYTSMQVGQEFTYTADEMNAMARAAGYEVVGVPAEEEDTAPVEEQDENELTPVNNNDDAEEITEEETLTDPNIDEPPVTDDDSDIDIDTETDPFTNPENVKLDTEDWVTGHGGKIVRRDIDGLKQDFAEYKLPESDVKVRRAFDVDGKLGDPLVAAKTFGNNDYVTLQQDEVSMNLGEMKLKKAKIDGADEKEYIVQGKTTDEIGETKYYKFIPKTGHPESDGENNRLGEEVFKVNGKFVTEKPDNTAATETPKKKGFFKRLFGKKDKAVEEEVTQTTTDTADVEKPKKKGFFKRLFGKKDKAVEEEVTQNATDTADVEKPKKKGFFKRLFGKKDKTAEEEVKTKQTAAPAYNFQADYNTTRGIILDTMKEDISTEEALEKIFNIDHDKADKMLLEVGRYSQEHDITTPEGKQGVYAIAQKYNVDPGKLQAFLDTLSG